MNTLILVTILAAACLTSQAAPTASPCVSVPDQCTCEKTDGSVVDLHQLSTTNFSIADPKGEYVYVYSPCGTLTLTNCTGDVACQTNPLFAEDFALGKPNSVSFEMNGKDLAIRYKDGQRSMLVTLKCNQAVSDKLGYVGAGADVYNFTLEGPAACATDKTTTNAPTTSSTTPKSTSTSTATTKTSTTPTTVTTSNMTTTMSTNSTTTPAKSTSTPKSTNMTTMPSTTRSSNSTTPSTTPTVSSSSTASMAPTNGTKPSSTMTSTMSTPTTTQGASAVSSMALVTMVSLAVLVRKLS